MPTNKDSKDEINKLKKEIEEITKHVDKLQAKLSNEKFWQQFKDVFSPGSFSSDISTLVYIAVVINKDEKVIGLLTEYMPNRFEDGFPEIEFLQLTRNMMPLISTYSKSAQEWMNSNQSLRDLNTLIEQFNSKKRDLARKIESLENSLKEAIKMSYEEFLKQSSPKK